MWTDPLICPYFMIQNVEGVVPDIIVPFLKVERTNVRDCYFHLLKYLLYFLMNLVHSKER